MVDKKKSITKKERNILTIFFWFFGLTFIAIPFAFYVLQSEDDLPPVSMLDNPPELLASEAYDAMVYAAVEKRRPFLGICVGMQLMASKG